MANENEVVNDTRSELEIIIDEILHKNMGKALDIMRTSEMSDRAMAQASRTLKDFTNELITYSVGILKERNYIQDKN